MAGWSTLLETYEATPVESWAFRQLLRGLVPADRNGASAPRRQGLSHPQSLTVVSLVRRRAGPCDRSAARRVRLVVGHRDPISYLCGP